MYRLARSVTAAALLFFILPAISALYLDARETARIKRITIRGNRHIGAGKIKTVMETPFPSFVPLLPKPEFDEAVLRRDIAAVATLYHNNGYFNAALTYALSSSANNRYVSILLTVQEGRPAVIERITLRTAGQLPSAVMNELNLKIEIKTGALFTLLPYERSKAQMEQYLHDNGYGAGKISGTVRVDRALARADILFSIEEGPLQRFGPAVIAGNKIVSDEDMRAELPFKEGDIFSEDKIARARRNIFSLGLFRSVNVNSVAAATGTVVPVYISVDEGDRTAVRVGAGYGNEDRLRAQAAWTRYYFLDGPRRLSINSKYSSIIQELSSELTQARFLSASGGLRATFGLTREEVVSYINERTAADAAVTKHFAKEIEGFAGYRIEVNRPVNVRPEVALLLRDTRPGDFYFISSVFSGFILTAVDDPLFPSRGSVLSLYIEPASFLLGSQIDYVKGALEGRFFAPLDKKLVFASRLKMGVIEPLRFTSDIPIFKRFFSGGSNSVRGYGFQEIGPKDSAGDPLGGHYLTELNGEFRLPLAGAFQGVIFVDAGTVSLTQFDFSFSNVSYGTGAGIRYITSFAPVGIDVAFPFEPFAPLNLGKYRLYFTLGGAF